MKQFIINFEHSKYGTHMQRSVFARNFLCAIVKAAKECGLKAKINKSFWEFSHNQTLDGKPSIYILR